MILNKKLVLCGFGGHAESVYDSILRCNEYEVIGYSDVQKKEFRNLKYLGTDEDLINHFFEVDNVFISVGSIESTTTRRRIFNLFRNTNFNLINVIDPSAIVSCKKIGRGVFIGKNAIANYGSCIGDMCIINTGAIIEHDCIIGDFSHISIGAVLCGGVSVGNDTFIGAGSVVRQGVHIGNNVVIGAGSVVVKDVPDNVVAYGSPCEVKNNE